MRCCINTHGEPGIVMLFTEHDLMLMRGGKMPFIAEEHTGGALFSKVTIGYVHNDIIAQELFAKYKQTGVLIAEPSPVRCGACGTITPLEKLYKDFCIVCWHDLAQRRMVT